MNQKFCANSGKFPDCATARKKVSITIILMYLFINPISVAAPFKAWVSGRSVAGVVGWNPAGTMDVCLFVCCTVGGLCNGLITRPEESK